jgi:hypothetical protein
MRKLFLFFIINFCYVIPSNAQNNSVSEFYSYLNSILENNKLKSTELLITNYSCLGSRIDSEIKFFKKENIIEIEFYSINFKDNLIDKKLDTTFTVTTDKLMRNFTNEINVFDKRVVFIEGSYKINVVTEISKKEFELIKADGLNYLLRYNMTFEEHYKHWLKKKNKVVNEQKP